MSENNTLKRNIYFAALLVGLLFIDQLTKYLATNYLGEYGEYKLIPDIFHFTYLRNQGAAWGMLQGFFPLFAIVTCIVISGLLFYYIRLPQTNKYNFLRFTIVLIAAGAIGNFIDRVLFRYVVDFLYFKIIDFPVFNVADIYVSISAVLIAYCFLIRYKDEELV